MIDAVYVRQGIVCEHHSGRVYTVLFITNTAGDSSLNPKINKDIAKFPPTVVYMGANGNKWSRPLSEFIRKFSMLHNGHLLVGRSNE